jgi:hypothetical protein
MEKDAFVRGPAKLRMHRKTGAKVKLLGKATEFERHNKPTIIPRDQPHLKYGVLKGLLHLKI